MKHHLIYFMILFFSNFSIAQKNNYEALWKKVDKLENEGLSKSALEIVENINAIAKKDKNSPQQIKALIYKSKYALILEEDAQLKVINDFKSEILLAEEPTKNILENYLANMYWQYFQQNRYQFYNRTKTKTKVDENDFRSWDLTTLFNEIHFHFQNSLKNDLTLQNTAVETYQLLLTEQQGSKRFRPTIYDILIQNALSFYMSDESSITQPAYKFVINESKYLSDYETFSELEINEIDTLSLQLNAIKLYQQLIKFHKNDIDPYALVDVDIERLKFINQKATYNNKEDALLNILNNTSQKFHANKQEVATLYDFEIATLLYNQGQNYDPNIQQSVRWKFKEALDLCNSTLEKFPNSLGSKKCIILKKQILQKTLGIVSEEVIPIDTYSKLLVRYQNIDTLNFKIYNVGITEITSFKKLYDEKEQIRFLKNKTAFLQWQTILKNEEDYQSHTSEVIIPQLQNGHYICIASTNDKTQIFATQTFQVTNLGVVEKSNPNAIVYQIIDRNNGKLCANADATLSYQENYNGPYISKKVLADSNGEIKIDRNSNRFRNLSLTIAYNNQTAYFGNYYISPKYDDNNDIEIYYKSFLFTDRSIYRPGQSVFFKGIVMFEKDNKTSVLENEIITVTLYDVNNVKIKDIELKTNAYGSVASEFILPNSGLTGSFRLLLNSKAKDLRTTSYFSVEEYKRPKFETKFKPVTETYKVNDTIYLNGNAIAYAGSNITDAKVVYRVKRMVQYPNWYYRYKPWFNSEPQEITYGEGLTDVSGNFVIKFKALPDETVDPSSLPVFNYEITADVTDINGETRSAITNVNVGYHALTASIIIDKQLNSALKNHTLNIDTKNLNGEFVAAKGILKMYKLLAPNRVLRTRPWPAPDFQVMTKKEFISKFPYEAYQDEQNSDTWQKGELVFEMTFDTSKEKIIPLNRIKNWKSGLYRIELETKDKFGQIVKDEVNTSLFNDNDKTLADNQLFEITTNKSSYNPNDMVWLTIGSSAKDVWVTLEVEKNQNIISTHYINLNANKKTISIPVTSDDYGGFIVHYNYSIFNTFQYGNISIQVPYPTTDLEIETLTFRDKLQPGINETWSFKIKGPKGDKVSAELLASMYDASLNQFKTHSWSFYPQHKPLYNSAISRNAGRSFGIQTFRVYNETYNYEGYEPQYYDQLNWFGLYFGNSRIYDLNRSYGGVQIEEESMETSYPNASLDQVLQGKTAGLNIQSSSGQPEADSTVMLRGRNSITGNEKPLYIVDGIPVDEETFRSLKESEFVKISILKGAEATAIYGNGGAGGVFIISTTKGQKELSQVKVRKNLQETAFFFPQLHTDANGDVSFNFTTPEALTQWKLQLLAHTKTLESTVKSFETVTQKELMVIPNTPRFLREGDEITISTKIVNLTTKDLSGIAQLILTDVITNEDITYELVVKPIGYQPMALKYNANEAFSIKTNGNTQVSWTLKIPDNVNAVQYKILAKSGEFSDGEQNVIPVLSNRMLVTETLPMWIKSNETKTFTLEKLKSNTSSSLRHHKLTLEMTSNPAWYAVQALPYLMEYPYDCNEQTFSRYYANALASHIANSNPKIQEVFNQWASQDKLLSNLEKNEELKNILIQETPWLRDAQSETEQKKRIALLFDINKMTNELGSAKRKLQQNQMENGAWAWFKGGEENRYITQHIITGFGRLRQLSVSSSNDEAAMIQNAIQYLDAEFVKEYNNLKKYNSKVDLSKDHLSYTQLHYLYMRSFFPEIEASKEIEEITKYYHTQIQKYWLSRSLYAKGLMALVTNRMEDKTTATKILKSLDENSITSEELGMYWKENTSSWYWYQAPIETQALMIEAFSEIENNTETIDNLKIWLLKNKQTNQWKTTKATTDAVYALLLQGSDWLNVTDMVEVVLGEKLIEPSKLENVKIEAGTGYYKTSWNTSEIKPEMATVKLTKKGNGIAWGSMYWQYFEDLNQVTSSETSLKLGKKLFLKKNTDKGEEISEIKPETILQVGDVIRVRIELRSDRTMEFIHMKDMRASGLEPINVLSEYKWQDGLGYYESTKDASTNFFIDFLPKGVFVFEYDLRVNNAGIMSNGITTIQSMYAPEFSSHSEGMTIIVE